MSAILRRPAVTAVAVAVASVSFSVSVSVSSDLQNKLQPNSSVSDSLQHRGSSWVSRISASKLADLTFVNRVRVPVPNKGCSFLPNSLGPSGVLSPSLINLYQSADLAKSARPSPIPPGNSCSVSCSEGMYRWHLPKPNAIDISGGCDCSSTKSKTVVVLLGWLGAKQRHLRRYADWYASRGFHVITFTFPMADILRYRVGGKAEELIDSLASHLADWLEEECGKNLVFHTFSNTGWLTYGVILERFQKQDPTLMQRIRGCIVDSAPVAAPDPQVWASGFSAAFLKKHSVATKGFTSANEPGAEGLADTKIDVEAKHALTESALLAVLEKFFEVALNLPKVNRRLSDVLDLLTSRQPSCPQLYIYSSADRVIPAESVESFIEKQEKMGHVVRACNFISTPHVDHFRNDPKLYTAQLTHFLEECVLTCCKSSS